MFECALRIKSARPEFLISRHVAQVHKAVFLCRAAIIEKCAWPIPNGHARYPAECQLEKDARQRSAMIPLSVCLKYVAADRYSFGSTCCDAFVFGHRH